MTDDQKVEKLSRSIAIGPPYGIGAKKLKELLLKSEPTVEDAERLLRRFEEAYPSLVKWRNELRGEK